MILPFLPLLLILMSSSDQSGRSFLVDFGNGSKMYTDLLPLDNIPNFDCFVYFLFLASNPSDVQEVTESRLQESVNGSLTCQFNVDQFSRLRLYGGFGGSAKAFLSEEGAWFCHLDHDLVCDGISHCLTDECRCQTNPAEVFYCFDGSGCVTFDKLCDATRDCIDGSDECYCVGSMRLSCPQDSRAEVCWPVKHPPESHPHSGKECRPLHGVQPCSRPHVVRVGMHL